MPNNLHFVLGALLFVGACSDDERAAAPSSSGGNAGSSSGAAPGAAGASNSGTSANAGAGAPASTGGADSSAGGNEALGGAAPEAGAANDDDGGQAGSGEPPYVEPLPEASCTPSGTLTDETKLPISSADADRFGAVTSDELVIAWTVVEGDDVTLHYAERASPTAAFTSARELIIPAFPDSVGLSSDGLRVVYVKADRKGFAQLVRETVTDAFVTEQSADFSVIEDSAVLFEDEEYLGDPVLGPDDLSFYYSRYGGASTKTILNTQRFSRYAPWPEGWAVEVTPELEANPTRRLVPTAVSFDRQTLFFWDAASEQQLVAELSHESSQFSIAYMLGDVRGATPNGACTRVYFDRGGDLWTATLP